MDPTSHDDKVADGDGLPRSRGDGPSFIKVALGDLAAPPLARGWTRSDGRLWCTCRGSPARAGMDPTRRRLLLPARGSPARAGMDPPRAGMDPLGASTDDALGAPPLARGWTQHDRSDGSLARMDRDSRTMGSPARAGMDPIVTTVVEVWRQAPPLARGWTPGSDRLKPRAGAPPLARGWTLCMADDARAIAGSPARAGMDPSLRSSYDGPG